MLVQKNCKHSLSSHLSRSPHSSHLPHTSHSLIRYISLPKFYVNSNIIGYITSFIHCETMDNFFQILNSIIKNFSNLSDPTFRFTVILTFSKNFSLQTIHALTKTKNKKKYPQNVTNKKI